MRIPLLIVHIIAGAFALLAGLLLAASGDIHIGQQQIFPAFPRAPDR